MKSKNYLFELGVEELPAADLSSALLQWREKLPVMLDSLKIGNEGLEVYGTPRRLVFFLKQTSASLEGLAKVSLSAIRILKFEKPMRWIPNEKFNFSRPIRWMLALHGEKIVPVKIPPNIESNRITFGPRFLGSPTIKVASCDTYFGDMEVNKVILDPQKRKEIIKKVGQNKISAFGQRVIWDEELLAEVANLVEYPTPMIGNFEERFLKIPKEVVVTVVKKHQRYFTIETEKGELASKFITVANQTENNEKTVVGGNERVIKARLRDAEFFFDLDRKRKLEEFVPDLQKLAFHEKLGNVFGKTERLQKLSAKIANTLSFSANESALLRRSAYLSKADLVTNLVKEFTSLQGIIGSIYAKLDGEPEEVSIALKEHYLPRFAGDALPLTLKGKVLAVADKVDTLTGFVLAGIIPKGSTDPYGLRRSVLGLIRILISSDLNLSAKQLISFSAQIYELKTEDKKIKELDEFMRDRIEVEFADMGYEKKLTLSLKDHFMEEPLYLLKERLDVLSKVLKLPEFEQFITTAKRVRNIIKSASKNLNLDESLLKEKSEQDLYAQYKKYDGIINLALKEEDLNKALASYYQLAVTINEFFKNILVMVEDEKLRDSRLALLQLIDNLFIKFFDPSKIN